MLGKRTSGAIIGGEEGIRLLSVMSHELRTPLNGIVGILSIFADAGSLNLKQKEYLTILTECSHLLTNLLNNILDFAKISSGRLILQSNPFDLKKLVDDAIAMVAGKAKNKNIRLISEVTGVDQSIRGDRTRLMQIFANLLSNAIKYTDRGLVNCKVICTRVEPGRVNISINVQDTGIGIPKTKQALIFEPFIQLHTDSHIQEGIGLGLSITKQLCKLMDGNITVESDGDGKGTTFIVNIILDCEAIVSSQDQGCLTGITILVVDDRAEYRMQLMDLLLRWKCIPIIVNSGQDAIQYLTLGTAKFGAAIVDIHMDHMSGVELATKIRQIEDKKNLPLIAISSVDLVAGRELFNCYLTKPIIHQQLLDCLVGCLCGDKNRMRNSNEPLVKEKGNIRILIVEDDKTNIYTCKEILKSLGYNKIKKVYDGQQCIDAITRAEKRKKQYDIVLMDMIMPIVNGYDATVNIRKMVLKRQPLIVAISAAIQGDEKKSTPVDAFLPKPITREKLSGILKSLFVENIRND